MLINLKIECLKRRNKDGLNAAQIGIKCNIPETHLSQIVNEKRKPTKEQKSALSKFFKQPITYLFQSEGE